MAKNTVPVNFKDDIMNSSMGGKRRYKMINNSDGTVSLEDATTYDQVGSNFGAAQINATNQAVNAAADAGKIIDDLDAINNVTQEGYMAGALALKQVNSNLENVTDSIGLKLLWENPNPTADFEAQTISLDLSDYSFIKILSIRMKNTTDYIVDEGIVGYGGQIKYVSGSTSGSNTDAGVSLWRDFKVSTNEVTFLGGWRNNTQRDENAIPLAIYGCK